MDHHHSISSFKVHPINKANCFKCSACYFAQNVELKKNCICMECETSESLWFCLECAHVGCGRFKMGHALDHYRTSKHMSVMNIETFEIWDYEQSAYLHHNLDDAKHHRKPQFCHTSSSTANTVDLPITTTTHCQCPVCRHTQIPKLSKFSICMSCGISENLWLCLNCSHIGCGRDAHSHAKDHYTLTRHTDVMHMDNFSIWNYKEEKYVHRLVNDTTAEIISKIIPEDIERLEDRMEHLENEWKNFCKLKETNRKMISIEQRLITLCDEKQQLEGRLREHDAKLNELLNQFKAGNRDVFSSPNANHSPRDHHTAERDVKNIRLSYHTSTRDVKNIRSSFLASSRDTNEMKSPISALSTSDSVNQSHAILFLILLLFLYHFVNLFKVT